MSRARSARSPRRRSIPRPKPFWDAAADGKLLVKRCTACGERHHYPRAHLPLLRQRQAPSGGRPPARGTIYSYSVMRRAPIPYAIAYVTLARGPTMMTNIVDCNLDTIRIGQAVARGLQADRGRSARADVRARGLGPPVPFPRSTERFLTTHTGSLPRPADLIRTMYAKEEGVPVDASRARRRASAPRWPRWWASQAEAGVDIVNDGEMSKPSYATYVKDRLSGFGGAEQSRSAYRDLVDFPEHGRARVRRSRAARGGRRQRATRPITVRDPRARPRRDADNLKAALAQAPRAGFMSAASPGVISLFFRNEHYAESRGSTSSPSPTRCARSTRRSPPPASWCRSIAPTSAWGATSSTPIWSLAGVPQGRRELHVEALNHALANIAARAGCACTSAGATTRARTTATCRWPTSSTSCSRRGPTAISFEAANPRHAHEWTALRARQAARGQGAHPRRASTRRRTSSSTPSWSRSASAATPSWSGRENVIAGTRLRLRHLGRPGGGRARHRVGQSWPESMAEGARRATKEFWR